MPTHDILEVIKLTVQFLIVPAFLWLRKLWVRFEKLQGDVQRVLKAFVVLANRERRELDLVRRLAYHNRQLVIILRFEVKRGTLSRDSEEALVTIQRANEEIQKDIDSLRDTAFRARSLRLARTSGEELDQGEVDAGTLLEDV